LQQGGRRRDHDESICGQLGASRRTAHQGEVRDPGPSDLMERTASDAEGRRELREFVNDTLLEMEKNGEAKKIFEKWFGPRRKARSTAAFS